MRSLSIPGTEVPTGARPHVHMNLSLPRRTPRFKDPEQSGFLELSYEELLERNMEIRKAREEGGEGLEESLTEKLNAEKGIKAITVCFSDMEGKLHALDFDKEHILSSKDNLTFDGSSISGFSTLDRSDLRLSLDWTSFKWTPADVFGAGKVLIFANIHDQDGKPYAGDFRSNLKLEAEKLKSEKGITVNMAPEIEGFLLEGMDAEQNFDARVGMKPASKGGYFKALPGSLLRQFIDSLAESTRAMAFVNEKDHPEVAPGQFELNYRFTDVLHAADQIQLYKITARQIAAGMGLTASFLPKPIAGINGSGMHSNLSISKGGKNTFYDAEGPDKLSEDARSFISGVLDRGQDMCLVLNSSVNAYRRLDPNFEAPNEIKMSASDRGSMVRVPLGNENTARMEVRTVAPDANPYLAYTVILRAGLEAMFGDEQKKAELAKLLGNNRDIEKLPGTIQEAIELFRDSDFITEAMGEENKAKYLELKEAVADRSPRSLGTKVKKWEVLDHHEVRDQELSKDY